MSPKASAAIGGADVCEHERNPELCEECAAEREYEEQQAAYRREPLVRRVFGFLYPGLFRDEEASQ